MSDDVYVLWTDGSHYRKRIGWAWVLVQAGADVPHTGVSGAGTGTNNVAELQALLSGLQAQAWPDTTTDLVVRTDSQYVIGVVARDWKPKANRALVFETRAALAAVRATGVSVWFSWCRGHAGHCWNEFVDAQANAKRT